MQIAFQFLGQILWLVEPKVMIVKFWASGYFVKAKRVPVGDRKMQYHIKEVFAQLVYVAKAGTARKANPVLSWV